MQSFGESWTRRNDVAGLEQQVGLRFVASAQHVQAHLPTRSADPVEHYSGSELNLSVPDEPLVLELLP